MKTTGQSADVIVIGGGLGGAAISWSLSRRGARVLLLESGSLAGGTSGACAGRVQVAESEPGEYLRLVLEGYRRLSELSRELDADLEWETPGHLTLTQTPQEWQHQAGVVETLRKAGASAEMLDETALRAAEPLLRPGFACGASLTQEAHVNPFKVCLAFARAAARLGAQIHTHETVTRFTVEAGGVRVVTRNAEYESGCAVVAAGAWSGQVLKLAGSSLPMRHTHAEAMVSEPLPPCLNHHVGMSGFYRAVHGGERTVTLGLGQHRSGTLVISNAILQTDLLEQDSTAWALPALCQALIGAFPALSAARIVRSWSAPSPFLPDGMPAVGWLPGSTRLFVAAGFHLALPTIAALCDPAAEAILSARQLPARWPFQPGRFIEAA